MLMMIGHHIVSKTEYGKFKKIPKKIKQVINSIIETICNCLPTF